MILYLAVGTWTTQYLRMSVSSSVKNWINAGLLNLSGFLGGSVVKKKIHLPMQGMWVQFLSQEELLEDMASRSTIIAWEIPWTEESGRLQSMGFQKSQAWLMTKQTIYRVVGK